MENNKMDKKVITEEIEMVEKFLDSLKKLEDLMEDNGEVKRGFKAAGLASRKASQELGKTLVAFRKSFSATE